MYKFSPINTYVWQPYDVLQVRLLGPSGPLKAGDWADYCTLKLPDDAAPAARAVATGRLHGGTGEYRIKRDGQLIYTASGSNDGAVAS